MYLSRLILNPRNRRVQREVAEPYQMHRSLMRAFPDDLAPGSERVLFRLERAPSDGFRTRGQGGLVLLVQSLNTPDWNWLEAPNARGYLLPVTVSNPAVKAFDFKLSPGQILAFRLRANPTVKRTIDGKKKRLGLYREEEQIAWLVRKGERSGFRVLSVRISGQDIVGGGIDRNGDRHKLRLLSVRFDGLLEVVDDKRLHDAVQQGIGSGKGLGFGLLSLARPVA